MHLVSWWSCGTRTLGTTHSADKKWVSLVCVVNGAGETLQCGNGVRLLVSTCACRDGNLQSPAAVTELRRKDFLLIWMSIWETNWPQCLKMRTDLIINTILLNTYTPFWVFRHLGVSEPLIRAALGMKHGQSMSLWFLPQMCSACDH